MDGARHGANSANRLCGLFGRFASGFAARFSDTPSEEPANPLWHYRHRPAVSHRLARRREGQPAEVIATADRAQQRLHARYQRMLARGKPPNKVVMAMARELVGFLWAALEPQRSEA